MSERRRLTRRSFLLAPALLPLARAAYARATPSPYHFSFDHIVGTSLDLEVWAATPAAAEHGAAAMLDEIDRLTAILSTREPDSEISRYAADSGGRPSPDLSAMLAAYQEWHTRTEGALSITPAGPGTPLNVDALGKAYILDRAADTIMTQPDVNAAVVN